MQVHWIFILILLLAYSTSASAIRCNSRLAEIGDPSYKFYKLCGEPDLLEKRVVYYTKNTTINTSNYHFHDSQNLSDDNIKKHSLKSLGIETSHTEEQAIEIEEWTYDFGSNRFIQKVTFVNGIAVDITSLGYGFADN